MHRKDFIKLNTIAALGYSMIPFNYFQSKPSKAFLTGKNNPYLNASGVIHKTAYKAYLEMQAAAFEDDIKIQIVSGFRSFDRQLSIWNRKFNHFQNQGFKGDNIINQIITYSTIPGTSRHHWGTDIDVIDSNVAKPDQDLLLEENYHGNGPYCNLKEWMTKNAKKFGFYLTYTDNYNRTGFNYEPWHYSYLPLSKNYLKAFLELNHQDLFKNVNIKGRNYLDQKCLMSYFETHLRGINPVLLS